MSIYGDEYYVEQTTFKKLQAEKDKRLKEFREAIIQLKINKRKKKT